ncbi:MAG: hypothetical protein LAP21_15155 [Acidobacteriia bacterium]|nr:hypothetical protein [Terriglobia bacterium]
MPTEIRFQIIQSDAQGKQTKAISGYILDAETVLQRVPLTDAFVQKVLAQQEDTDKLHIGRQLDGKDNPDVITIESLFEGRKDTHQVPCSIFSAPDKFQQQYEQEHQRVLQLQQKVQTLQSELATKNALPPPATTSSASSS